MDLYGRLPCCKGVCRCLLPRRRSGPLTTIRVRGEALLVTSPRPCMKSVAPQWPITPTRSRRPLSLLRLSPGHGDLGFHRVVAASDGCLVRRWPCSGGGEGLVEVEWHALSQDYPAQPCDLIRLGHGRAGTATALIDRLAQRASGVWSRLDNAQRNAARAPWMTKLLR